MIAYLALMVIVVALACVIRIYLFPDTLNEPHIPTLLRHDDVFVDGNRILYRYNGEWYEAIAKSSNKIYIYDRSTEKVVAVPYVD